MKKISLLSNILVGIFSIYLLYLPISFFGTWAMIGFPLATPTTFNFSYSSGPISHGNLGANYLPKGNAKFEDVVGVIKHAPLQWKFVGGFFGLVWLGLSMIMTTFIIYLFKRYSKQHIFDVQSVRLLRRIAIIFLSLQVWKILSNMFETYVFTLPEKPVLAINFGSHEAALLILGLLVFAVSWIMQEGQKMRDEQLFTI